MVRAVPGVSLFVLAIAFGCSRTARPLCDICTTRAVVYGTIRSPTGVALGGALVTVDARRDSCSGPIDPESDASFQTRSDGVYRVFPISLSEPFLSCVVVRVTPPPGSGLAATADSGAVVHFSADYSGGALDSTRVDIQLRAAP